MSYILFVQSSKANVDSKEGGKGMSNKHKKKNNQFKENKNSGEQRNGRLSQYKNHNIHDGDEPNEYMSQKED